MKQSHRPLWGAMAMCILLSGCTPDELVWDLPDTNPVHVDNAPGGNSGGGTGGGNTESLELCGSNNCSQISSVNAELTTGPSWEEWGVISGYSGQCFRSSYPGYVEFDISTNRDFRVRFWLSSFESGYWEHDVPSVFWNGNNIGTTIFSGDNQGGDGDDWVQRETDMISSGDGILRIQFNHNSRIYSRKLDEVEWWCLE